MKLDALVLAAHPDDAEIWLGGTLLLWIRRGWKVGIVDLTRGELGSRGDRATRDRETAAANAVLGVALRRNLELPDGRIECTLAQRERLALILREHAPHTICAHHQDDVHPDHAATGRLAREAWYLSGLRRLAEQDGGPPATRARRLYHFLGHARVEPTLVVDIGAVWQEKLRLVRCYESQLRPQSEQDKGEHFLFGADILQRMETKARFYGELIGVRYGEPLYHAGPLPYAEGLGVTAP